MGFPGPDQGLHLRRGQCLGAGPWTPEPDPSSVFLWGSVGPDGGRTPPVRRSERDPHQIATPSLSVRDSRVSPGFPTGSVVGPRPGRSRGVSGTGDGRVSRDEPDPVGGLGDAAGRPFRGSGKPARISVGPTRTPGWGYTHTPDGYGYPQGSGWGHRPTPTTSETFEKVFGHVTPPPPPVSANRYPRRHHYPTTPRDPTPSLDTSGDPTDPESLLGVGPFPAWGDPSTWSSVGRGPRELPTASEPLGRLFHVPLTSPPQSADPDGPCPVSTVLHDGSGLGLETPHRESWELFINNSPTAGLASFVSGGPCPPPLRHYLWRRGSRRVKEPDKRVGGVGEDCKTTNE